VAGHDVDAAPVRALDSGCAHVIEQVLPPQVASCAMRGDGVAVPLFAAELLEIRGAVDKRRREFTTGRACARFALAKLQLPPAPIPRGAWREPIWPDGVVGSITHCNAYCAAAAAFQRDVLTIGIDAEPNEALPSGTLEQVAVPEERAWLTTAPAGVHWDRLLFSAKESVFKAWFPLARTWLGFEQAIVVFHPTEGTFDVQLLVPCPAVLAKCSKQISGRYLVQDGLIVTAIALMQ
jgi:4'-phosphopantetheinyl transferase EntD